MIFTSLTFMVFFGVVFAAYWCLPGLRTKHVFLLIASIVFYSWWDYRFLVLIGFVITVSYLGAIGLDRFRDRPKLIVSLVMTLLLAVLGVFKYASFLLQAIADMLHMAGLDVAAPQISIVLPVGISFFTFHGISYIVDVYRRKIPVEYDFLKVSLYILFFPQLIAGPIVRASNFMPQLAKEPKFDSDDVLRGIKLFLIGLLYKSIIADSIAPYVDSVYGDLASYGPADQVLATLGFYAQIYFDFAGYSIMAIGVSRSLGYRLPRNFNFPYASLSVTEFWRRWHISLSTWLRDYLYISLGGNRSGEVRQLINIMITMLLGGLWHGASWNFVVWGGMHGLALCIHKLYLQWQPASRFASWSRKLLSAPPLAWFVTQLFVLLCWAPFRAVTFTDTMRIWHSFLQLDLAGIMSLDGRMATIILLPLLIDTLIVSGKVRLPLGWWQTIFVGRPWRLAFVLGAMFAVTLMVMPLEVKAFIYFRF